MNFEELPYAFCRHATSKISDFADIYHLNSYGFRGEALASMASIARLTCRSIPQQEGTAGGIIEYHGGELISHHEIPANDECGTSIYIRDLFYNTPARLKFVKSKVSEKSSLKRIIHAFILTHPHINFSIKWDQEDREIYPALPNRDISPRIKKILLKKSEDQTIEQFTASYDTINLTGYFTRSSSKGHNGKGHFLFANQRLFNDQQLHRTVMRGLEIIWPEQEVGHYVLLLEIAPDQLDVNVHPSKTQIKFFNQNIVSSLISAGIKEFTKRQEQNLNSATPKPYDHQPRGQNRELPHTPIDSGLIRANETQKTSDRIISLGEQFFLCRNEDCDSYALVDASLLLASSLIKSFSKGKVPEESIIPLLISDPYSYNKTVDCYLPNLLELGFEFDRLTATTLVLRSIPAHCSRYKIGPIINSILRSLYSQTNNFQKSIERGLLTDASLFNSFIDPSSVYDLFSSTRIDDQIGAKATISLTRDVIQGFFNSLTKSNSNE